MEKLSGLVIDFYDDPTGEILKRRFPNPENLPQIVKEGALLDEGERGRLRDELFALVMKNGDEHMRKFACTDGCNTVLSTIYLMDHAKDVLPEATVKTAAQNLLAACDLYKIQPPESLSKLAGAIPDEVTPFVDVTEMEAEHDVPSYKHCLTKEARYPIDSYEDVLTAQKFFEKNAKLFHPSQRREYCLNLSSRAEELGVPVTETIEKYASDGWTNPMHVKDQIRKRMEKTASEEARSYYSHLFTKIGSVHPGVFANMLMQVDEATGLSSSWDGGVEDPFAAVLEKQANTYSYTGTQGTVDEEDLMQLKGYRELLTKAFGEDFADEFKKNPVDVFKALPEPEKNTIIKLVAAARKW